MSFNISASIRGQQQSIHPPILNIKIPIKLTLFRNIAFGQKNLTDEILTEAYGDNAKFANFLDTDWAIMTPGHYTPAEETWDGTTYFEYGIEGETTGGRRFFFPTVDSRFTKTNFPAFYILRRLGTKDDETLPGYATPWEL